MIKIKICDSNPQSACAYYRSIGPLAKLKYINDKIEIQHIPTVTWHEMADADILFLDRPQEGNYLTAIKMAKNFNVPIWVDYDDNLHCVPEWNPSFEFFSAKTTKEHIEQCIQLADIVTVATPAIKKEYEKFNKNIHVVENAFNNYNYKFNKINDQLNYINWRGSITHRKDLRQHAGDIFSVAEKHKNKWGWVFIGNDVWYMTENIEKSTWIKETDIINYHKFIEKMHPSIQMVPLVFDKFNVSKSNCSWIEGTFSGSTTLAPDLPEFQRPGIINYKNEKGSFGYYLEKMIKSKEFRIKNYLKSYDYIQDNLMLSKINLKRIKIVEELLDKR